MRNAVFVILVLLVSLLLYGCGEQTNTTTGDVYVGGTRGLEFKFNTPFGDASTGKDIVYEKTDGFSVEINAVNYGEYTVEPEKLMIKLVDIKYDNFTNLINIKKNERSLDKIERGVKTYSEEDISFKKDKNAGPIKYMLDVPDNGEFEQKITAYACYPYVTKVSTTICFRNSKNKLGTCENTGDKAFSVSGAPIQVVSVKQSPSSTKVNVVFQIKNIGNGKVFKTSDKMCELDDSVMNNINNRESSNKVIAKVISGGITCDGSTVAEVRMGADGIGTLQCEKEIDSDVSNIEQVTVEFSYQYQQSSAYTFYIYDANRVDFSNS